MAVNLKNYYDNLNSGEEQGYYPISTVPNPNDPNNNSTAKYGGVTWGGFSGVNPAPLMTFPVSKKTDQTPTVGNSGEGLLSSLSGGGLSSLSGVGGIGTGGLAGGFLNIADGATGGAVEKLAAGALDAARITKFFATPQGIAFNLKQTWLQTMNTKVPHKRTSLSDDTRIYNLGFNILAQIPLEAIDIHINRHGLLPGFREYPNQEGVYSEWYAKPSNNTSLSVNSSLYTLHKKLIGGDSPDPAGEWFSYGGGPKSQFGLGRTKHRRWVDTTTDDKGRNLNDRENQGWKGFLSNPTSPDIYPSYKTTDFNPNPNISLIPIQTTSPFTGNNIPFDFEELNNKNLTLQKNAGIGRVAGRSKEQRIKLTATYDGARDTVNFSNLLKANTAETDIPKDLIKFRFESISNDNTNDNILIIFRAFLSGINDRYSPNWNSQQYVGRGEKFYTYDGFARDISFNFTMATQTRDEVKPLMQKLNYLTSNTMPDYNTAGRMRGPFMKLTIGDYLVSLPGFISSLNYTIKDDAPWDIALYKDLDGDDFAKDERELPHMIDVSVTYTPIHNFLPKKGTNDVFYILGKGDEWITSTTISSDVDELRDIESFDISNLA